MEKSTIVIVAVSLMLLVPTVQAEKATVEEALMVAENWIRLIIGTEGHWGDSDMAYVETIDEFVGRNQVIGYFCRIKPQGFIVISLHKELAPIKAYSTNCNLNPESDEGMADLLKGKMERVLDSFQQQLSEIRLAQAQDVQNTLEINYRFAWNALAGSVRTSEVRINSDVVAMNYAGGSPPLLSSRWSQGDPYNAWCPAPPSGDDCQQDNCTVGCTPLAGAQVMRYWAWPPGYDWTNMPDAIGWIEPRGEYYAYYDGNGNPCTQAQIDAVAELCYDVGVATVAEYCDGPGCATSAVFDNLLNAFEDYFVYFDAADNRERKNYSEVEWFNLIKGQLNKNRPVPYSIPDHVIVCDGWQEYWKDGAYLRQYHMNYGWAGGCSSRCPDCANYDNTNTWYTLDALSCSAPDEEKMIVELYPQSSLGSRLRPNTTYQKPGGGGCRYFDQDCTGQSVTFEAGHCLQFLAGVKVTCTGEYLRFEGNTRLFSIERDKVAGIRIYDGDIRLCDKGSIKFHTRGPKPSITVISPNGGEVWEWDVTQTITWQTQGTINMVDIEYSTDNGATWYEVMTVLNTGSYDWLVPNWAISDQCLVRVNSASNPSVFDTSDSTFSIIAP